MKFKIKLCVLLTALLLLCTFPTFSVEATEIIDSGTCGENATWTLDADGTLTISGTGSMFDYSNGKTPWANYATEIKAVVVEEGVSYVGSRAFQGTRIVSASIPGSVISIGDSAFADSGSLTEVTLSEGLTSIGNTAFANAGFSSIDLPSTVTSIGSGAFLCCNGLTSVTIPKSVLTIQGDAFTYCEKLSQITFTGSAPEIDSYAFNKSHTAYYPACNPTWTEDKRQNYGGEITWVPLNEGNHSYEDGICVYCGAEEITTITGTCGENATWTLDADGTLTISGSGAMAFSRFSKYTEDIKKVIIEDGITSIDNNAFSDCSSLASVSIPGTITSIGENAFYKCTNLKSIVIPDGVTSIGKTIFYGCTGLSTVSLPKGLTSIPNAAFYGCSNLSSVVIPDGVTSIGSMAFYNCSSLSSVVIPKGVTSIGGSAFSDCKNLTSVIIPDGVTSIGNSAFSACSNLSSVNIPNGVISIGFGVFSNCSNLISIDIPGSVTSIGESAFGSCSSLTSIIIPGSVASIGRSAFSDCSNLSSVVISNGVTYIGKYAFFSCPNLTSVNFPDSVISIDEYAFGLCHSLPSIDIPRSVTTIGNEAFLGCYGLKNVAFYGAAPNTFGNNVFLRDTVTIQYPSNLPGWEEAIKQTYGAEAIEWKPYTAIIDLEGATMTLSNSLSMNFVVDMDYLVGDGHYAVITRTYADGSTDKVTCSQDKWTSYNKDENHWYFSYENIAAKEMTDVLTVVVYNSNGEPVSTEWIDSPRDYCMRAIRDEEAAAEPNTEKLALYVDMLNYGAAAQDYFDYDTEDPANNELTDTQKAYATGDVIATDRQDKPYEGYKGGSLTLFNEIRLNFVFYNDVISTDMYAVATYIDHYGDSKSVRIEGKDFKAESNKALLISVTGMAVADYDQAVTCTVYDGEDVVIAATDSVASYVLRATAVENHPLFDAVLKFGYSAKQVFKEK